MGRVHIKKKKKCGFPTSFKELEDVATWTKLSHGNNWQRL